MKNDTFQLKYSIGLDIYFLNHDLLKENPRDAGSIEVRKEFAAKANRELDERFYDLLAYHEPRTMLRLVTHQLECERKGRKSGERVILQSKMNIENF